VGVSALSDIEGDRTDLPVGALFAGRFLIEGAIGSGGMGRVYRARDRALDEQVALKTLSSDAEGTALERFKREVRLARRITHQNVARTFDIGEHAGVNYLTMEFVTGPTLRQVLKREGPRPLAETVRIVVAMCNGLDAAHHAGVVHRDLKPSNVVLEPNGRVVILDFGIARPLREDSRLTHAAAIGTPAYMSPEQLQAGDIDSRSDLYSLGLLLHELAAGVLPSWDGVERDPLARLFGASPSLALSPEASGLAPLVLRLLDSDPGKRPATAREVASELELLAPAVDAPTVSTTPFSAFAPLPEAGPILAVLPFRVPVERADFSRSVLEELIDALSRVPGLRVISARATAKVDPDVPPEVVGKSLGADVIVDGTLRIAGDRLRLTARLIDVANGFQRWSERFEGLLDDPFDLADRLVQQVAEALRCEISMEADRGEASAEARELFLLGRRKMRALDLDGLPLVQRAVELAPGFRAAVAASALAHVRVYGLSYGGDSELFGRTQAALDRALIEAPNFPETQLAAGVFLSLRGDYTTATRHLRFALKLAPTHPEAQEYLGILQIEAGLAAEAVPRLKTALTLDPGLVLSMLVLARHHALHGRKEEYDSMLAELKRRVGGDGAPVLQLRLRVAVWSGDRDAIAREARPIRPDGSYLSMLAAYARVAGGAGDEESRRVLEASPEQFVSTRFAIYPHQLAAEAYSARGEPEHAVRHVIEAADSALLDLEWLQHCPPIVELRGQPGFEEAVQRVRDRARAIWLV
jgi:eukaryotic-like serine/threonine-protein kinase